MGMPEGAPAKAATLEWRFRVLAYSKFIAQLSPWMMLVDYNTFSYIDSCVLMDERSFNLRHYSALGSWSATDRMI